MNDSLKIMRIAAVAGATVLAFAGGASAQELRTVDRPTYADLVDYSDPAELVVKAQIRKQAIVERERAPGLAPDHVRLYMEAQTKALIAGNVPVGESLKYLVDVPMNAKGKAPKLRKADVLIFGRTVPGRPGELQLVAPSSQLLWTPELEARLRPVLAELVASDAPPAITGIRDALSIEGNLVGESETQIFLSTQNGDPASISIIRTPGQRPVWGVSWTEIVDAAARPPRPETLEWYRLACSLPDAIGQQAMLTSDAGSSARTQEDYAYVRAALGECLRNL